MTNEVSNAPGATPNDGAWFGFLLNQAASRFRTRTAAALAPLGITPPMLRALEAIAADRPLTQARLGVLVGMDRTTVLHLVDRFEALGMARRDPGAGDRRAHAVTLTPEGAAALAEARRLAGAVQDDLLSPLSTDDLAALAGLLRRIVVEPTPCPEVLP